MSALRSKKGSLTTSIPGQHSCEGNRCTGVYLRNMAESMNQKGMTIVKGSHTPIAAPVIDREEMERRFFPFPFPDYHKLYYTLLHELACNIASYCTSGCGIFTSRRRVKMQPTSVIKCSLSTPE